MLDFLNDDGTIMTPTESVSVGGFQSIVPDKTKLLMRINGLTIEPESDYYYEHIIVDLEVIQKGEFKGYEFKHRLEVTKVKPRQGTGDDNKAILAAVKKCKRAKETLLAYDYLSGGELYKMIILRQDVMDVGVLNRVLSGLDFTGKVNIMESKAKAQVNGVWTDAYNPDGSNKKQQRNYIGGVENKAVALALIAEDANINQQSQNQPNAPLPDPVNLQHTPAPLTPTTQVQQAQQPQQPSYTDNDIPF